MRKLVLTKEVLKELPDLPAKQYRQVVGSILDLLADRASPTRAPKVASGEHTPTYVLQLACSFLDAAQEGLEQ